MTATAEDKIIADFEIDEAAAAALDETSTTASATADVPEQADEAAPMFRIVKGNPTDTEIGALVAVLAAAASTAGTGSDDGKPRETWGDPTRMHRQWAPFSPYSYPARG